MLLKVAKEKNKLLHTLYEFKDVKTFAFLINLMKQNIEHL